LVYLLEIQGKSWQDRVSGKKLFNFTEQDVQAIALTTPSQTLKFVRNSSPSPQPSSPPPTGPSPAPQPTDWQMQTPTPGPANDASVVFLVNLLATASRDRIAPLKDVQQRKDFGLDQPSATIEVTLKSQKMHKLILGKANFNNSGLYALVDPPANLQPKTVLIVPYDFQNATSRPLSDWQQLPPSPTPSLLPSPSALPNP
jgi:hypothetical protein